MPSIKSNEKKLSVGNSDQKKKYNIIVSPNLEIRNKPLIKLEVGQKVLVKHVKFGELYGEIERVYPNFFYIRIPDQNGFHQYYNICVNYNPKFGISRDISNCLMEFVKVVK